MTICKNTYENLDIFQATAGMVKHVTKYTKFRPFPTTVGTVNHMRKNYTKDNEQILGTFVHKSLDFFRPLQVWSKVCKNIHKFRPFLNHCSMVQVNYQMRKFLAHTKFRLFQTTAGMVKHVKNTQI